MGHSSEIIILLEGTGMSSLRSEAGQEPLTPLLLFTFPGYPRSDRHPPPVPIMMSDNERCSAESEIMNKEVV